MSYANISIKIKLFQTQFIQENRIVILVKLGNFRFKRSSNCDPRGLFTSSIFLYLLQQGVVLKTLFIDIGNVHDWLGGDKTKWAQQAVLVLIQAQSPDGLPFI